MSLSIQDDDFTEVLNAWVINNDLKSANHLKSIVYYHLKSIVKKQVSKRAEKSAENQLLEDLPNTTSLLHDVWIHLTPPIEIVENRQQYFESLALFVRWMLLDELKAKSAKKRNCNAQSEQVTELLEISLDSDPYFSFDLALSSLEALSPRCYRIALMHYYLGYSVEEITAKLKLKKSTVYNELAAAKAFISTQFQAA